MINEVQAILGLGEQVEQFIFGPFNSAFGARFAVSSGHMFFSKHSYAKFKLLRFSKFQVTKFDLLVGPIRTVIRTDRFDVFQFTATDSVVRGFNGFRTRIFGSVIS